MLLHPVVARGAQQTALHGVGQPDADAVVPPLQPPLAVHCATGQLVVRGPGGGQAQHLAAIALQELVAFVRAIQRVGEVRVQGQAVVHCVGLHAGRVFAR